MSSFKDLTGQKFGYLTVIKRAEDHILPSGKRRIQWLCECDCGNEVVITGCNLKSKHTQSCGCLAKAIKSKIHKEYNEYDLSDDYGVGYTSKGEKFYFDLEDYNKIKNHCWYVDTNGYIVANNWKPNRSNGRIYMHRLIMECDDSSVEIDHINHEKYNNKKNNLRIVTRSQNNMNNTLSKNNTSGITGVYLNKDTNKWVAQINVNNKTKNLGSFDKFEDAKQKRKTAEDEHYGEYSYDNSMKARGERR